MRAVLLKGHGGPDQLEFRSDVPRPEPRDDEVLVRVGAAGVNNTDINMRVGWYSKHVTSGTPGDAVDMPAHSSDLLATDSGWTGEGARFPLIQGADVCGVIVATGADVLRTRVGERVLVDPVLRDRPTPGGTKTLYLGSDCHGAFAEYVCVPSVNAHAVDVALSDVELASFPCSYSAAENMLTRAGVRGGDAVLITGASGGVGSAAVQLAKRRGARVSALAGGSKLRAVEDLGALRVLPRDADLVATLGKNSMDVVIDVVGGGRLPELLDVLRPAGRYAVAGAIAGPLVTLDLRTLYLKDLQMHGCTIPDIGVFSNLVGYIAGGQLKPLVAKCYPMREIVLAQQEFQAKTHVGKIVLVPSG